jgi:hypothetical protein
MNTLLVWTGQLTRYNSPDLLDITVKGDDPVGKYLAPTWDMVTRYRRGVLSEKFYSFEYSLLIANSFKNDKQAHDAIKLISRKQKVTFVCYCKSGAFCHRHLAINAIRSLCPEVHVKYMGEH